MKTLGSKRGIQGIIVKSKVSFKAYISVGHIFTIPTSGNILLHLHRLLFHTSYTLVITEVTATISFHRNPHNSVVIMFPCIVLRIERYSRQIRQIGRRERQMREMSWPFSTWCHTHGVTHLHGRAVSIVCCTIRTFFSTVSFTAFHCTEC